MAANWELQPVKEWGWLRGFANLLRKENRAWWGTRLWWINAVLWPVVLCGLMANILFVAGDLISQADFAQPGERIAYITQTGLSVFFEFGSSVLAIGIIVLANGLIINEKQNGVSEWLLSKPMSRQAYILSKLTANFFAMLVLLIGIPACIAYGLLSLHEAAMYPLLPFISAVSIMIMHTFFYLTLTLMLGTIFNNRGPILGIGLGSALGGSLIAGFYKPLMSVTPWMLPKVASITANGQAVPTEIGIAPLAATALWSVIFILAALARFERTEF